MALDETRATRVATVAVIALACGLHAFVPRQANAASLRTMTARSVEGRLIKAFVIGNGGKSVLLIGGIHGNEPSGVRLVSQFERWAARHWRPSSACTLVVVGVGAPKRSRHIQGQSVGPVGRGRRRLRATLAQGTLGYGVRRHAAQ